MRPFRFGVQASDAADVRSWRELARQCEQLGYSTLFLPDHLDEQWGPLVGLTVAAEATTTLRVGSLVFDNDYRHPMVLAKEMATLDLISEGRVEMGLGAGWKRSDYDAAGIGYDPPRVRIDRMAEGLAIMKDLWTGRPTTFAGDYYTLTSAEGRPLPYRSGGPRIIIGGGGRRVLTLAARQADIVGFNPSLAAGRIGPDMIASAAAPRYHERVAWVREAAGARFDQLDLQVLTFAVQVVADRERALADLAAVFGVSASEVGETPLALIGSVDQLTETLTRRRQELGFNYWVVHASELDAFAPVVARLAGN